jgi:hypothetical protein
MCAGMFAVSYVFFLLSACILAVTGTRLMYSEMENFNFRFVSAKQRVFLTRKPMFLN